MIQLASLIEKLLRSHLKALVPYQSARRLFSSSENDQAAVWLNANESAFSREFELQQQNYNRYPDCQPAEVIAGYASYTGLKHQQVLCTRGADEGIELLIRTFCEETQDSILICPPTYGMYAISAETCNVAVKKAPLNEDFSLDIQAIDAAQENVKLVFICAPNNPTGTYPDQHDIKRVLDIYKDKAIVVVDEAYIEFCPEQSVLSWLDEYANLVILRTLSKAFGLAGLRCGFTLAAPEIIASLLKVIAPYPVSAPVAQIASQALSNPGLNWMSQKVTDSNGQRSWLFSQLENLTYSQQVWPSTTNFILFRYEKCKQLFDYLVAQNIFIRDQSKQLLLDNCLRISIGTEQQNQQLINAVKAFESKNP